MKLWDHFIYYYETARRKHSRYLRIDIQLKSRSQTQTIKHLDLDAEIGDVTYTNSFYPWIYTDAYFMQPKNQDSCFNYIEMYAGEMNPNIWLTREKIMLVSDI